jgi:hypothetical protein
MGNHDVVSLYNVPPAVPYRAALLFLSVLAACSDTPTPPLADGEYSFELKDAEFPLEEHIDVIVRIRGERIFVVNPSPDDIFPQGELEQGKLLWHTVSKQWIIAHSDADATAPAVGGCGTGPSVIDLTQKIYWAC